MKIPGRLRPSADGGSKDGAAGDGGTPDGAKVDGAAPADAGPPPDASPFGRWQPVGNPPFAADVALLLTDGTVMVHDYEENANWWRLRPDSNGSYVNGTWSSTAPMPAGYEPLFFASAVLKDGRVVVIGGEYNAEAPIETSLGALYDPSIDEWVPIEAPQPLDTWYALGDAPSVVLPDGTFMIGAITGEQVALFDERTLTWTNVGAFGPDAGIGKVDQNAEEGWTLLPNGKVLTIDVGVGLQVSETTHAELFDPGTREWSSAGSTGMPLAVSNPVYEIGPAILLPNGSVFATGATANTAIYSPTGTWAAGPSFPTTAQGQLDIVDGCAALLPNGNVLCAASPGDYQQGSNFYEYDGTALNQVPSTPNAAADSSFNIFFLVLPTGEVLSTDDSTDIEIYAATGAPNPAWAPTITSAPTTVVRGTTYPLRGTQFNGLSQAVAYGDDFQGATNYPLVRIANTASGQVTYGRTHDHSTMGVATGAAAVSTLFEAPSSTPTGPSMLVVVANGIASTPVAVTVQ